MDQSGILMQSRSAAVDALRMAPIIEDMKTLG
jgi:hypothetical protein